MTKQEHCKKMWEMCIKYRDRWCVITGEPHGEAHHIIYRSEGNWQIQFDTDYGVLLCAYCHKEASYAPHVDKEAFEDKVIGFIEDEVRRQKILTTLSKAIPISEGPPIYEEIAARLGLELRERKEAYEMNYDCCPREIWR